MEQEKALQVFKYKENEIRTVIIDGEIWFVAADACRVLDHSDVSMAVSRLDEDEKLIQALFVSGQNRQMLCINEPGFYSLVLTSRKSEAKPFKRWVTHEVIPSIRRTGRYSLAQPIHTASDALRERALLNLAAIPVLYFAIIGEAFKALYNLEALLNRNLDCMAEIEKSLGQCWSTYARDVLHIPDSERVTYRHVCVDGKIRSAWAYPIQYLPAFEKWLWLVYIPEKFPAYAKNRAKRIGAPLPQINTPTKQIMGKEQQLELFPVA